MSATVQAKHPPHRRARASQGHGPVHDCWGLWQIPHGKSAEKQIRQSEVVMAAPLWQDHPPWPTTQDGQDS